MRIKLLNGKNISRQRREFQPTDTIETFYLAADVITVGQLVKLEADRTNGDRVLPITTAAADMCLVAGVYEGIGGTGAATEEAGLSGNHTEDGNAIFVTTFGPATALVDGLITAGSPVIASATTAGSLTGIANGFVPGYQWPLVGLQDNTAGENAAKKVYCRLM